MNTGCALLALAAAAATVSSPLPAQAMVVLTLTWADVHCTGLHVLGCSTTPGSFSAMGKPGEQVSVSATLHYEYHDDGQPLEGSWAFPGLADPYARERNEVGALYFYSNACASHAECMARPIDDWGSFSPGSGPYVLGRNATPDSLSGDFTLLASGRGTAWVSALGVAFDARGMTTVSAVAPAIPEPTTYALMIAGLLAVGVAARRHALCPAG